LKLVNVVQRHKYKKELINVIREIAPELLSSQSIQVVTDKLVNLGLVSSEEKIYFDIRLQAKIVVLMIERLLEEHGIEAIGSVAFIDKDHKAPGTFGKVVHLSGPHVPDDYVEAIDGLDFHPFFGICGRAYAKNEIVSCHDIDQEPLFEGYGFMDVFRKYNIHSVIAFPIHVEGETIGTLSLFSQDNLKSFTELIEIVKKKLYDLENVFTVIQENWYARNRMSYKAIIDLENLYYIEESCLEVLGYEPSELIHGKYDFLVHEDDFWELEEKLLYLKENLVSVRHVMRLVRKDGQQVFGEALYMPITGEEGLRYIEVYATLNTKACYEFAEELRRMNIRNGTN
jgi:hypothetical protein